MKAFDVVNVVIEKKASSLLSLVLIRIVIGLALRSLCELRTERIIFKGFNIKHLLLGYKLWTNHSNFTSHDRSLQNLAINFFITNGMIGWKRKI